MLLAAEVEPHLRILLAVPGLAAAVCVWLWLPFSSPRKEPNVLSPPKLSHWCGDRSFPRMPCYFAAQISLQGEALKRSGKEKPRLITNEDGSLPPNGHCFGI